MADLDQVKKQIQDADRKMFYMLKHLAETQHIVVSDRATGFYEGQMLAFKIARQLLPCFDPELEQRRPQNEC